MQRKQFTIWLQTKLQTVVLRIAVVVGTGLIAAMVLGILGSNASASNLSSIATVPEIIVYHSPECSCCDGWMTHLKTYGFKLKDFTITDIEAIKQKYNVQPQWGSDIKRLLREQPDGIDGLSVPQMPVGTPGMELGNHKNPFSVLSFNRTGKVALFSSYP